MSGNTADALRNKHGSAFEAALAQIVERSIRLIEWKAGDLHLDAGPRRDGQKFVSITAGQIRHRQKLAFLPQQPV